MKIVGVGLHKTGTKTLQVCLKHWGFKHISCNKFAFNLWLKGNYYDLLKIVREHESFEDWPWPLIYKEIDIHFPNSKFILTTRKNASIWYKSLLNQANRINLTHYRKNIYGYDMPQENPESHIDFYKRHNDSVRQYFKDRPGDFLDVCWENGDGWNALASFLDLDLPDIKFPHANKSPSHILNKID